VHVLDEGVITLPLIKCSILCSIFWASTFLNTNT
jgi:hypothetical protein